MIKKQKLFGLAAIVTAILFIAVSVGVTSCSEGPQGPEGPMGPAGSSGTDGSDGSSGQDGQDGTDGRPAIPVVPCTVTYDTGEGTKVDPQELMKGDKANRPENAFRQFTLEQMYAEGAGLYRTGVSNGWILLGWKMQDGSYYDFDEPVTADIHLTADWAMPGKISTDSNGINAVPADTDFFDKALDFVIKEPASYYLVLDDDYIATTAKTAAAVGISLTIVGLDSERTITCGTTNGRLFQINNEAQLHLENNITLKGKVTASTSSLIYITNGSLTMNDGSIITGYTTSTINGAIDINSVTASFVMNGGQISGNQNTNTTKDAGIVCIHNAANFTMNGGTVTENTVRAGGCINILATTPEGSFTMNSGTITGNTNTNTGAYPGGVYIQRATATVGLAMSGGSITGNTGIMGDVFLETSVTGNNPNNIIIFEAGDAVIGTLTTVRHVGGTGSAPPAQIKIGGNWTGSVQTLNLYYTNTTNNATFPNVATQYLNKNLVAGYGDYTLTSAIIDNFKQVNFMRSDFQIQGITGSGYVLVRTGANIGQVR
jgi:hypothetical protein